MELLKRFYEVNSKSGHEDQIKELFKAQLACLWDMRRIAIAKTIADALNRHFESDVTKEYDADLKKKKSGY